MLLSLYFGTEQVEYCSYLFNTSIIPDKSDHKYTEYLSDGMFYLLLRPLCCAPWRRSRGVTSLLRVYAQTACYKMRAHRRTTSCPLLSGETRRWLTWRPQNRRSCTFSCRWRASPADTTRPAPPSPSSADTLSSAENTENTISGFSNFLWNLFFFFPLLH